MVVDVACLARIVQRVGQVVVFLGRSTRFWYCVERVASMLMPLSAIGPWSARVAGLACLGVALSGCASISVPFGNMFDGDAAPQHTASSQTDAETPTETAMPETVNAVQPIEGVADAATSTRPADDLVAAMPDPAERPVTLSQSDLNAMGRALTHVLESDPQAGTFSWSHEATGRSGLMTPFRRLSTSSQGACRVVSVEITDNGHNTILLADACLQNDEWVFVTPRAGQAL